MKRETRRSWLTFFFLFARPISVNKPKTEVSIQVYSRGRSNTLKLRGHQTGRKPANIFTSVQIYSQSVSRLTAAHCLCSLYSSLLGIKDVFIGWLWLQSDIQFFSYYCQRADEQIQGGLTQTCWTELTVTQITKYQPHFGQISTGLYKTDEVKTTAAAPPAGRLNRLCRETFTAGQLEDKESEDRERGSCDGSDQLTSTPGLQRGGTS